MWSFTYQFPATKECSYGKAGACCSVFKTLFYCIFKSKRKQKQNKKCRCSCQLFLISESPEPRD